MKNTPNQAMQYTPNITTEDVERILKREFTEDLHSEIRSLINGVTVHERLRIIIACFKNANKDFTKLANELENANGYWRETISDAEYPKIKKASNLTEYEINKKMKNQYLEWLNKS